MTLWEIRNLASFIPRLLTGIGQNGQVVIQIIPQFVWQNPQLEIRLCHKSRFSHYLHGLLLKCL